jgi:hypothetical protein
MVAEVQASVDRVNAWLGGHGLQIVLQGCNNLGGGDCFFYTVCRKLGFGEDHVAVRKAAVEYAMQPTVSSQGSTVPWIVAQKGEETVIDWLSQYEQLRLHDNVLDALDAWAPLMIQPGFFADEIVITAAADMLGLCVVSFYESSNEDALGEIEVLNFDEENANQDTLLVCCQKAQHFFQLWHSDLAIERQIAEQAPRLQELLLPPQTAPTAALEEPAEVWMTRCSELEARNKELGDDLWQLNVENNILSLDRDDLRRQLDDERRWHFETMDNYNALINDLQQQLDVAHAALAAQAAPAVPAVQNAAAAPSLLQQHMQAVANKRPAAARQAAPAAPAPAQAPEASSALRQHIQTVANKRPAAGADTRPGTDKLQAVLKANRSRIDGPASEV